MNGIISVNNFFIIFGGIYMRFEELFIDGRKLPDPLSKQELFELLDKAKHGDEEARNKVIIHNIRLVLYQVSNRFVTVKYNKKDLASIGIIGLMKAIKNFDTSRNINFAYYAVKCIDNEILMFIKKLKRHEIVDSLNTTIIYDKEGKELTFENILFDSSDLVQEYEDKEIYSIIRKIVNDLPDRDRKIITLYFGFFNNKRHTQKEIADKLSLTQSYVSRLIIKILKEIRKQLEIHEVIESKTEKVIC